MPNQRPSQPERRSRGYCDGCHEHKPLNMIYDALGINILRRLCDDCLNRFNARREKNVGESDA